MGPFDRVASPGSAPVRTEPDLHALVVRVTAEFQEMPGLRLTLAQAERLFGIDTARCAWVLNVLVERRVLAVNGRAFMRADTGATSVLIRPLSRLLD
jgi:hypothetical protein